MKIFKIIVVVCCMVGLVACGNQAKQDKKDFDQQMTKVIHKEQVFNKTLDEMSLDQLSHLSREEITDKNKETFKNIKKKINRTLKPQFDDYKKEAEALPDTNEDLNSVKQAYLMGIKGKEQEVEQLERFVTLCISSIDTNEHILENTQQFEKHRSNVEKYMKKAQSTQEGVDESRALEEILESNNNEIQKSVEDAMTHDSDEDQAKVFKNTTIPLIQQQIKTLNQKQLSVHDVSLARQSAIEMYYDLAHYYQSRIKTIEYSKALSEIDVHTLIQSSKDLKHYDEAFQEKYENIDEAN
ncbi:EMYY motif lipoprotein [Staphylococcus sp. 17KM0847]|uniref:EMYY motif lipoprotein n=1 Tax=Staphylococcus sp. 17KM0847 TaxID=2583989 RepID=UPI0015DE7D9F|nr:EMYY motif lipoprotein [Staphylococcus sp. 17KM0847]